MFKGEGIGSLLHILPTKLVRAWMSNCVELLPQNELTCCHVAKGIKVDFPALILAPLCKATRLLSNGPLVLRHLIKEHSRNLLRIVWKEEFATGPKHRSQ